MEKIPVKNDGSSTVYVGASAVLPGETRHFHEHEVPHHLRPKKPDAVEEALPGDPLAEFLTRKAEDVLAVLSGLSTAEVERLGALEQAGKKRKGVLSAIAETLLNRAANADMLEKVARLADEELAAALVEAGTDINTDPEYVAALEAEAARRKGE